MEIVLPIVLGILALAYISQPFWMGASSTKEPQVESQSWSAEQLELDRDLGKIDEREFRELNPDLPVQASSTKRVSVEALIGAFRRQKRVELAVEAEVLVARARRKKSPQ